VAAVIRVEPPAKHHLAQIVHTTDALGFGPGLGQGRQKQRGQNRNDGDDDEQFD
jgi:hypothetical protein